MNSFLHLAQPLLHQVDPVDQLLDGAEEVQVGLGDLLAGRVVHAVNRVGAARTVVLLCGRRLEEIQTS